MSYALNMHSACKVMVASGIAKSDAHLILTTLEREQKGSGSEFLLKRLKTLRQYCECKLMGKPASLPWFRTTRSGMPKDLGWRKLVSSDPEKGIQNVSVLIMDMIHKPDQKTKDTIYDNIFRHDPISQDIRERFATPTHEFVSAFNRVPYPLKCRRYAPDTLQGVSFPLYEGKTYRVKATKTGEKDKDSLLTLYYEGLCSAPMSLADHLLQKANTAREMSNKLPSLFEKEVDYLDVLQDIVRVEAFDNLSGLEDYGGDLSKVEIPEIVGSIGVIPSPGMKDRVIANPNPAVQSALYNLGEFLGQVTKHLEGCYVYDQKAGIRQIQEYLSQGITLASVDMSAATDRLSAEAGWDLISNCVAKSKRQRISRPIIEDDLAFFKKVSRSAFYIGNLGEDDVEYVSYTQGQPMGLKPSFPMLTLMNIKAGKDAQAKVPESVCPIVVGDDIVIDARCLDYYLDTIQGLGGKVNLEKTLVSNTHVKFCSRIITSTSVIREKPRYVEGDRMQNALQLGNLRLLKPWERSVALSAASQSLNDLDEININVDQSPLVDRITDRAIQRLVDNGLESSLYTVQPEIAKLSLDLRRNQETDIHQKITSEREQRYQYETGRVLSDDYDSLEFVDYLSEVDIPVQVTRYDHHTDSRSKPHGDIQRIKKIAKSSKSNEVSHASFDHHEGSLLYDKHTALFEPTGSNQVLDITESLREQQSKVTKEVASRPLSHKRRPLPSNFEDILKQWEERDKDDDEFSH